MTFAWRIVRLQSRLQLTRTQIAEIFGVDYHTVSGWIEGRREPALDLQQTLLRLESDNLAAISPNLRPETIKAFNEGRERARCAQ
jgi:hypothetical protein